MNDEEALNELMKKIGQEKFERLKADMREIADGLKRRAEYHREKFDRPPTPSSEALKALDKEVEDKLNEKPTYDFGQDAANNNNYAKGDNWAIHPQSRLMTLIYAVQSLTFLYNAWAIPLRFSFHIYQNEGNRLLWAAADYSADALYLLDTAFIKTRVMFLNASGIYETDWRVIARNLIRTRVFLLDAVSLLPLDAGYFFTGFVGRAAILRAGPVHSRLENLFDRLDSSTSYPMFIRLIRTINIMLYLIHINACAYYTFSDFEGLDSSPYVFNGHGHAYIRCFFVALKTSVSIGINPKPGKDRPWQMIFMGCLWLAGVFVFAVLIGNVKDIIAQSTASEDEYKDRFDTISGYMHAMRVPSQTVTRVRTWCRYTWATQKSFDEMAILENLPLKLRTDVTMNVHYETLKTVQLFHGCDSGLLKELVVKLRPIIFLDGDYICKKGDIGKEMFIITVGQVQVVGGPDNSQVFVTLGSGVCFGEIALLGSGGMNRRTATIRALGYTTLYVLYKEDLNEALNSYPEDRELLSRKAQRAAKEVAAKREAERIKSEEEEIKRKTEANKKKKEAENDKLMVTLKLLKEAKQEQQLGAQQECHESGDDDSDEVLVLSVDTNE